jgi:uncharacterized protein
MKNRERLYIFRISLCRIVSLDYNIVLKTVIEFVTDFECESEFECELISCRKYRYRITEVIVISSITESEEIAEWFLNYYPGYLNGNSRERVYINTYAEKSTNAANLIMPGKLKASFKRFSASSCHKTFSNRIQGRKNRTMNYEIKHSEQPGRGTFSIILDGDRAGMLTYSHANQDHIMINHTGVSPHLRGKGFGKALVKASVKWARENNIKVTPICSFVRDLFDLIPEWRDVLKLER